MENWISDLAGAEALSPVAREPITKTASLIKEASPEAHHEINQHIDALRARMAQIKEAIENGSATQGEQDELVAIRTEMDELLDLKGLTSSEDAFTPEAQLSVDQTASAVDAFGALVATNPTDVRASLQSMFPEMTDEDFESVKRAYWKPVFAGEHTHDIAGTLVTADVGEMGEMAESVVMEALEPDAQKCRCGHGHDGDVCDDCECAIFVKAAEEVSKKCPVCNYQLVGSHKPDCPELKKERAQWGKESSRHLVAFVKRAYPFYGQDDNLVDAIVTHALDHADIKPHKTTPQPFSDDPSEHRDPMEIFRNPNQKSQGPHCEDAGMMSMNSVDDESAQELRFERAVDSLDKELMKGIIHQEEYDAEYEKLKKSMFPTESLYRNADGEGLNGYICFWRGKQFEVYAKTTYEAQQKCAKENGIKKSYEIRVELAEKGGEPVVHQPQDIMGALKRRADEDSGYANQFFYDEDSHSLKRKDGPKSKGPVAIEEKPVTPKEQAPTPKSQPANAYQPLDIDKELEKELGPGGPESPKTPDGNGTPENNPMVKRRIELAKKLQQIKKEVDDLRIGLTSTVQSLQETVDQEQPELMAMLEALPDWKLTVDGWIVELFKSDPRWTPRYKEILDHVEELIKDTNKPLFELIQTLKKSKEFGSDTTPRPDVKVKNTPQRSKSSWDALEDADISVTADIKEWWAQFKGWVKRTFTPKFEEVQNNFEALKGLLSEVQE